MGKKAKKRKERRAQGPSGGEERFLEVDAHEAIMRYVEDPDFETLWTDPRRPLFCFVNHKTGEFAALGDQSAIAEARRAYYRSLEETRQEFADSAHWN